MRSMTGFGSGEVSVAGVTVTVELRAVNHRFLDVALKLPAPLAPLEGEIRNYLKEHLARGRITCLAQVDATGKTPPVVLDRGRLVQGLELLQEAAAAVKNTTGRPAEITLDHLLMIPDLFCSEEAVLEEGTVRDALQAALTGAVEQLQGMREREGQGLAAELAERLGRVHEHLQDVLQLAPQAATEALERLRKRLDQLTDEGLDPQRLAQEAAILADRSNINEECERLTSHLEQFQQALAGGGQVAKRLNFLLQEMHREVNTMGSKTSLLPITRTVIEMKDEIESMREQVQNLE